MKTIITICAIFCLFVSCNNGGESEKKQIPVTADYTPNEEDQQWINIGYDLKKGRPLGLKAGAKAPDFQLKAPDGSTVKLSETLKKGPVALLFYRGEWCPVCIRYFSGFIKDIDQLEAKGVQVIAVGPETNENIQKTIEKSSVEFKVLQDADYKVMEDYDVLFHVTEAYQKKIREKLNTNIAKNNGKPDARLPVPATYLIGQDGLIKYVQFDLNYKSRASVKDILKHI